MKQLVIRIHKLAKLKSQDNRFQVMVIEDDKILDVYCGEGDVFVEGDWIENKR
jgi:hypothetical protein